MNNTLYEERCSLADYFMVVGLDDKAPTLLEDCISEELDSATHLKNSLDPIVDIAVIFRSLGEEPPHDYQIIESTPFGYPADLNHGSLRSPSIFLCFRRGRDKPPIVDIGVMYEGKERIMSGCEIISQSPYGRPANVNNSGARTFITYRRALPTASPNELVVSHICIVFTNKGEKPPQAFMLINKNLNKGMVGSDVYICYKKSVLKDNVVPFKPVLLNRYPQIDNMEYPLPENAPLFLLPMGATLEKWPKSANIPDPLFSTFVLTNLTGQKAYGAAISFYKSYPVENIAVEYLHMLGINFDKNNVNMTESTNSPSQNSEPIQLKSNHAQANGNLAALKNNSNHVDKNYHNGDYIVYTNKAIGFIARWPLFSVFKRFLQFLYHITLVGSSKIPIERYIYFFMHKIPFPSPSRPQILVQLPFNTTLSLIQTFNLPMGITGASFVALIQNLSVENILNLVCGLLCESKILMHSLRPSVLTGIGEALRLLIFPLQWQCSYIPLCPILLSQVLNAPVPYIIGIDSRYFEMFQHPPHDAITVDLDTNTLNIPEHKRAIINYKNLPKKMVKVIKHSQLKINEYIESHPEILSSRYNKAQLLDDDFKHVKMQYMLEKTIQDTFIRFMACWLINYQHFLIPITKSTYHGGQDYDVKQLFDFQGFLYSRERSALPIYACMLETQMFSQFIQDRSFVTIKDSYLTLFDEFSSRVDPNDDRDDQAFLKDLTEENVKSNYTVYIPPPDNNGLPPGEIYKYPHGFSDLNLTLFEMLSDDEDQNDIDTISPSPNCFNTSSNNPKTSTDVSNFSTNEKKNLLTHSRNSSTTKNIDITSQSPGKLVASPIMTRTKQEIKHGKRIALINFEDPVFKARFLLNSCFSIWFIYLPAYIKMCHNKQRAMYCAFDILTNIPTKTAVKQPNEICYRILLQLCCVYKQQYLAVRVLREMRRVGIQPNAVTYGYYNKAVSESMMSFKHHLNPYSNQKNLSEPTNETEQQSENKKSAISRDLLTHIHWSLVRNVVFALGHFRRSCPAYVERRNFYYQNLINYYTNYNQNHSNNNNQQYYSANATMNLVPGIVTNPAYKNIVPQSINHLNTQNNQSNTFPKCGQVPTPYTHRKRLFSHSKKIIPSNNCDVNDAYFSDPEILIPKPKIKMYHSDPLLVKSTTASKQGNIIVEYTPPTVPTHPPKLYSPPSNSLFTSPFAKLVSRKLDKFISKIDKALLTSSSSSTESRTNTSINNIGQHKYGQNHNYQPNDYTNDFRIRPPPHNRSYSLKSDENNLDYYKQRAQYSRTSSTFPEAHRHKRKVSLTTIPIPLISEISLGSHISSSSQALSHTDSVDYANNRTPNNHVKMSNPSISVLSSKQDRYGLENTGATPNSLGNAARLMKNAAGALSFKIKGFINDASTALMSLDIDDSDYEETDENSEKVHQTQLSSGTQIGPSQHSTKVWRWEPGLLIGDRLMWADYNTYYQDSHQLSNTSINNNIGPNQNNCISTAQQIENNNMPNNPPNLLGGDTMSYNLNTRKLSDDMRRHTPQYLQPGDQQGQHLNIDNQSQKRLSVSSIPAQNNFSLASNTNQPLNTNLTSLPKWFEETKLFKLTKDNTHLRSIIKELIVPLNGNEKFDPMRKSKSCSELCKKTDTSIPEQRMRDDVDSKIKIKINGKDSHISSNDIQRITFSTEMVCPHCQNYIYDEDIISGWYPDDSNLNTKCRFCKRNFVPNLSINIRRVNYKKLASKIADLRNLLHKSDQSIPKRLSNTSKDTFDVSLYKSYSSESIIPHKHLSLTSQHDSTESEYHESSMLESLLTSFAEVPRNIYNFLNFLEYLHGTILGDKVDIEKQSTNFVYQYLSPLVLQKELENIFDHEASDECLLNVSFVERHACVYWNMLWYFHRLCLPNFLPNLLYGNVIDTPSDNMPPNLEILILWEDLMPYLRETMDVCDIPLYICQYMHQNDLYGLIEMAFLEKQLKHNYQIDRECLSHCLEAISKNDLFNALLPILQYIQNDKSLAGKKTKTTFSQKSIRKHGLYHEIMWLAILLHENLNYAAYDYEYKRAFHQLKGIFADIFSDSDYPPNNNIHIYQSIFCGTFNL